MDVVLVNDMGQPIGQCPKEQVHTEDTPLHLAFSCHVFNAAGQVLVTRRALAKKTWPGVWTNSFCGHPQPGEELDAALRRHARHELGLELANVQMLLPDFRYRAVDASGIVENEICPVFRAEIAGEVDANETEVMDWRWVDPAKMGRALHETPWAFSPWLALQAEQLPFYTEKS